MSFQWKCYYFGEGAKRWIQARHACSGLQGRLVSIHSREEQVGLASAGGAASMWSGGGGPTQPPGWQRDLQPCPAPQDFLAKHSNKKGSWIGLQDLDQEGEFVWMDQGPLDYR